MKDFFDMNQSEKENALRKRLKDLGIGYLDAIYHLSIAFHYLTTYLTDINDGIPLEEMFSHFEVEDHNRHPILQFLAISAQISGIYSGISVEDLDNLVKKIKAENDRKAKS